jgi:hypothetical protein
LKKTSHGGGKKFSKGSGSMEGVRVTILKKKILVPGATFFSQNPQLKLRVRG